MSDIKRVADAGRQLRALRRRLMDKNGLDVRELYRMAELPGNNPLRSAQMDLDIAVRDAFGMSAGQDPLPFLLELNLDLAARQDKGELIQGPGLPRVAKRPTSVHFA